MKEKYGVNPDLKIEVAEEQRVLTGTDRVVFQFSMYWYSSSALLRPFQATTKHIRHKSAL